MMRMQFILGLFALVCSAFSFAGTSNISSLPSCKAENLTIPCEFSSWDLGVQALYLQPSFGGGLGFLPTTRIQAIDPDGNWGYRLQGSYYFSTGNDVNLNWTHYDANSEPQTYAGQNPLQPLTTTPFELLLNTKYDQVNLVLGQLVSAGPSAAHFYAGFQYAAFKIDETSNFATPPIAPIPPIEPDNPPEAFPSFIAPADIAAAQTNVLNFSGAGPVLGVNLMHIITPRFSINANTQGSIVYGTSRFNAATALRSGFILSSLYGSQKILVPSLEAKIGANYAYPMLTGVLNLEGGYQAVNYFSALSTSSFLNFLGKGDFGMFGPYVGIRWLGQA